MLILAVIVGYIAMLILSPIPVLGPILAGFIAGLIIGGIRNGMLAGFLSGTIEGILAGIMLPIIGGLLGSLFGGGGTIFGGLLGAIIGAGIFLTTLYFGLLGLVGGALGGLSDHEKINLENEMAKYIESSGESIEEAIVILEVKNEDEGVRAEYSYLAQKFGIRGKDWQLIRQGFIPSGSRQYDKIEIELSDHTRKTIYFDITSFFGKF